MRILDYIFYRIYIKYTSTNNYPSKFVSWLFVSLICLFLSTSIFGLLHYFFLENQNEIIKKILYFSYGIFTFYLTYRRYYNQKRISLLICKYSNCIINERIPYFIIYLTLPFSMIFGIYIYYLLSKFILI